MPRPLLAWLLLLNYLLVVGADLRIERPGVAAPSIAHPYIHSAACQQQHYLLLDCFEQCNDDNQNPFAFFTIKVSSDHGAHFQAQTKALEVHFGTDTPLGPLAAPLRALAPALAYAATGRVHVTAGFGGCDYPPPQRG